MLNPETVSPVGAEGSTVPLASVDWAESPPAPIAATVKKYRLPGVSQLTVIEAADANRVRRLARIEPSQCELVQVPR